VDCASSRRRAAGLTAEAIHGIDVDGVTRVINYDLPNISETYMHRIDRTKRGCAGPRRSTR